MLKVIDYGRMMSEKNINDAQSPFLDLPAALVEEVMEQTSAVAKGLLESISQIREDREKLRTELIDSGIVISESDLGYPPIPTTCASDGSYAIERLLTTDLIAAAAVAVEGLTPPSEKRHLDQPFHKTYIKSEPHHEETATILSVAGTYYPIEGAFSDGDCAGFTLDSDTGVMTYTGAGGCFLFNGSSNLKSDKVATVTYALFVNGVNSNKTTPMTFEHANAYVDIGITGIATLQRGDELQVKAKSNTTSTTITVANLRVTLWGE